MTPGECVKTGSVTLFHPSRTLNAYQAALAFEESHLLRHFETGFYDVPRNPLRRMLSILPTRRNVTLERELKRRRQEGLSSKYVRSHWLWDSLFTLSARLRLPRPFEERIVLFRNERFDAKVAGHLLECRPRAVMGYDTCCLKTFEACQSIGALRILEQVVGHAAAGAAILEEERRLHPDWADSIPPHDVDRLVDRCLAEVRQADFVLAPSDYVRDTLIQAGVDSSKIVSMPYGVDIERFQPKFEIVRGRFRVLFVGQIGQRKGVKYLLEAWKRLGLQDADLILVGKVVGRGLGLRNYTQLFRHVPSVPHWEIQSYFQAADLFVFPSLHEGSA